MKQGRDGSGTCLKCSRPRGQPSKIRVSKKSGYRKNFDHLTGSEYLTDGTENAKQIFAAYATKTLLNVHSMTVHLILLACLRFLNTFQIINYKKALAETYRVLKPEGHLVATFPFRIDLEETLVRAKVMPSREIEHLKLPEFHGDPLRKDGVLCYYHFGWDILDYMRAAGYTEARCVLYWFWNNGYLGGSPSLFHAIK